MTPCLSRVCSIPRLTGGVTSHAGPGPGPGAAALAVPRPGGTAAASAKACCADSLAGPGPAGPLTLRALRPGPGRMRLSTGGPGAGTSRPSTAPTLKYHDHAAPVGQTRRFDSESVGLGLSVPACQCHGRPAGPELPVLDGLGTSSSESESESAGGRTGSPRPTAFRAAA